MKDLLADRSELGQVLPITALFMTTLLLFAALAVDVTSVLSSERFYTTTADAAALAGAQDLQKVNSREVTATERERARSQAMKVLVDELEASPPSGATCATAADIIDCPLPGTPYLVSIETPAPHCEECDVEHALRVTIRNPSFELTFARLAGQETWNVESSAVAGLAFPADFALIALKPQANYDTGIVLNGSGTTLRVSEGDAGTNTHLVESSAEIILSSGAKIHHYNETMKNGKLGFDPASLSRVRGSYINDPGYAEPLWPTDPNLVFDGQTDPDAIADCPVEVTDLVDDGVISDAAEVVCYRPGVYLSGKGNQKQFSIASNGKGSVVYLLPGAYKFEGGLDVNGYLYGGLVDNESGVLLSVPNSQQMDLESAEALVLNTGAASAATDYTGTPLVTPAGLWLTFYVPRDEACFAGTTPIESNSCSAETNATVKVAGTSAMNIRGVIYAPTERISIRGNSSTDSIDGQIVGWTLEWSGGSTLNLNYPGQAGNGILRLDAACTGVEVCS